MLHRYLVLKMLLEIDELSENMYMYMKTVYTFLSQSKNYLSVITILCQFNCNPKQISLENLFLSMKQCEMCGNKFCPICHAVTFKFAQSVNFPKRLALQKFVATVNWDKND